MVLIILGVLNVLFGNFIGGIWWFMIGMFLRSVSQTSYQQVLIRSALEGENIARFMNPKPITVSPNITVEELVDDYIYKYHYKMFPVVDKSTFIGCVTLNQIRDIPRSEWKDHSIGELVIKCSDSNTIDVHSDSGKVLSKMKSTDKSRLMVVDRNKLIGIISLKDMLKFLSLKVDLEES
jgi:predicted transcriptional regulator